MAENAFVAFSADVKNADCKQAWHVTFGAGTSLK